MPRFSIKDLMLAITMVTVGLSIEFAVMRWDGPLRYDIPVLAKITYIFVAFGAGGAMIVAGVLAPFHKKAAGAAFGFVVAGSFFVFQALMGI